MVDESSGMPYGARIAELAAEEPDRVAIRFVRIDGTEVPRTAAELDARACHCLLYTSDAADE